MSVPSVRFNHYICICSEQTWSRASNADHKTVFFLRTFLYLLEILVHFRYIMLEPGTAASELTSDVFTRGYAAKLPTDSAAAQQTCAKFCRNFRLEAVAAGVLVCSCEA
jgi:hypothetical protein